MNDFTLNHSEICYYIHVFTFLRVHLEYMAHKVTKANRVSLEWKACLVPKGTKGILVPKVPEETKETEEKWECQDFLESMVFLECKDPKDKLQLLVLMDVMEQMYENLYNYFH